MVITACQRKTDLPTDVLSTELVNPLKKYEKVEALMKQMTLEEKIGQMNLYSSFYDVTGPAPTTGANERYDELVNGDVGAMLNVRGVENVRKWQKIAVEETRLGIPLIFGYDVIHGLKTLSPVPLAEAASWDLTAIQQSAAVAAREAAAVGINWTFAPMIDISRDARWGRVMEGGGEDTYLGSKIAAARVRGFQGDDLSSPYTIAACAKHFAGYGFAEGGRDYNTVDVSGSILHNVILPPFKAALDAGVATFMSAFNDVNGIPAVEHDYLHRDLLKGSWGFEGMVVSDWGTIREVVIHGRAADLRDAAKESAIAGCDMDMEARGYSQHLAELVRAGEVDSSVVDEAARRVLNLKYELGLFEDPYRYCDADREEAEVNSDKARAAVRDMARKSMVLLKNQNNLLPLKSGQKIAVIGPHASDKNSVLGGWRLASDDNTAVSIEEALSQKDGFEWSFHQGVRLIDAPASFIRETVINETDKTGIDEAVAAAKAADMVILAIGEHGYQSGEGRSRARIGFPGLQQELMERIYEANPNIVLVSMSGRPLAMPWAAKNIPAILHAWQLGTESGNAIADVLMGDYNPSGKLPVTFPKAVGQVPLYYNHERTGRPDSIEMVFWSHYIDQTSGPQYPFGYGLSYTTFDYKDLSVTTTADAINVSVTVSNTGDVVGEEVAQLYIHDVAASMTRPVRELKGFDKLRLAPGESQRIEFILTEAELGFYDNDGHYLVEHGDFNIMVGTNSQDVISERVTW
jgi:beta-glucosidase